MDGSLGFWIYTPAIAGVLGLLVAVFFYFRVKALPEGNETMQRIAGYIREGAMAFLGTAPIGSLIAGLAADRIGAQRTILLGGLSCIAAGVWFTLRLPRLRELVRPIYVERGILAASQVDGSTKSL